MPSVIINNQFVHINGFKNLKQIIHSKRKYNCVYVNNKLYSHFSYGSVLNLNHILNIKNLNITDK
jgi:hypothetical protein